MQSHFEKQHAEFQLSSYPNYIISREELDLGKVKLGYIQKDLFDQFKMRNLILEECIFNFVTKITS